MQRKNYQSSIVKEKSETYIGYFFRFKLNVTVNSIGKMIAAKITGGNIDGRTPVTELTKKTQKSCIY